MIASTVSLYETDFVLWTEAQAETLRDLARAGTNLPLDWENLAEEVESLGRSQRSELRSRIATIIEHLLKIECSPAIEPRRGWAETVTRQRLAIERLLEDSPSLKSAVPDIVVAERRRAARLVASNLELYEEATPEILAKVKAARYGEDQVLGDWLPNDPRRDRT